MWCKLFRSYITVLLFTVNFVLQVSLTTIMEETVNLCAAFPLKCPEQAQWKLRANGHCADPSKYFCLQNDLINGYSENCTRSDFQQPGDKAVLRGGIDADSCSIERYQPSPIKFYTNASTNCIFLRSFCNEEGQVVYDNGNRNKDATCRCDHRKGYDFLNKPNNKCFCTPSQEDCSCYLKRCPNSFNILSPDYKCIYEMDLTIVSVCRLIKDENHNDGKFPKDDNIHVQSVHAKISSGKPREIMVLVMVVVISSCLIFGGTIVMLLYVLVIRRISFRVFNSMMDEVCNGHVASLIDPTINSHMKATAENQLLYQGQDDVKKESIEVMKYEEQTQIRKDEDIQQTASLYGIREENEIRFVMVGRTGSGKSATGNTIMAKTDHFESKLTGQSVTLECKRGECIKAGRKIVLVDTPGLFDTHVSFEKISKEIIRCVNMSTPGPHAFLIVVQIARFTNEEIETFNRLFDLFGDEMGKFSIITFTRLDDLEREHTTIEQYIERAPAKLIEFLNRCNCQYIAIDNKASEKEKKTKVENLIQLVDSIINKNGGKCYTNTMYQEAEAALQRKIQVVEQENALEKKKEIERIQSTFVNQIDSIRQENEKLAKEVSSKEKLQRKIQRDKEKALQEIKRMKEDMEKIEKTRNDELYRIKKQEKEVKEKQVNALEEKEIQHTQFLQSIHDQQIELNRKYQEMEQQKKLQLSIAGEQHSQKMEAEIQRIIDGNNQKYNEMKKALESKDRAYEKLQDQMAQKDASIQDMMREKDQRSTELIKQQDETIKRLALEKKRAEETLIVQLEEQKNSEDVKTKAILQDQMERNKTEWEKLEAKFLQANKKQQDALMQEIHKESSIVAKTASQLQKQRERDEKQKKAVELKKKRERDEIQRKAVELKKQKELEAEIAKKFGCRQS